MDEPPAIHWSVKDVVCWIKDIGFPQYADCFASNFIDGKKLVLINGSTLPRLGIQDYEHIKAISREIKANVLKIECDKWDRSISLETHEPLKLFFLEKSWSSRTSQELTYQEFINKRKQAERKKFSR